FSYLPPTVLPRGSRIHSNDDYQAVQDQLNDRDAPSLTTCLSRVSPACVLGNLLPTPSSERVYREGARLAAEKSQWAGREQICGPAMQFAGPYLPHAANLRTFAEWYS